MSAQVRSAHSLSGSNSLAGDNDHDVIGLVLALALAEGLGADLVLVASHGLVGFGLFLVVFLGSDLEVVNSVQGIVNALHLVKDLLSLISILQVLGVKAQDPDVLVLGLAELQSLGNGGLLSLLGRSLSLAIINNNSIRAAKVNVISLDSLDSLLGQVLSVVGCRNGSLGVDALQHTLQLICDLTGLDVSAAGQHGHSHDTGENDGQQFFHFHDFCLHK